MPIEKPPRGTRGVRSAPSLLSRIMTPILVWVHRRSGDRFQGMEVLYLTTIGAKTGSTRTTPVARIDDGEGGWILVASAGGAAEHPAWYHNIVAHPEQVSVEVSRTTHRVTVDQLAGEERAQAWSRVVGSVPRFAGYLTKTDRQLPVLRVTPVP